MLDKFAKKEAPIQGMMGMGGGVPSRLLTLASGTTTYVDDVFSTFLYKGTGGFYGSAQTINNGIDLSGEGGLVWIKNRDSAQKHILQDTARGTSQYLSSNETGGNGYTAERVTAFNSNGFTVGKDDDVNKSTEKHCSWTFRKCPGFFDVVTYTGNGSHRDISHSLGSEPGSIWIKRTDTSESWIVYHRSLDSGGGSGATAHFAKLELESDGAQYGGTLLWSTSGGGEDHTSTTFHVSGHGSVNSSGGTYVAYLFAHNDGSFGEDSDEAVIKCDSYTGSGSSETTVDLGFEPQWVLIKGTDQVDWALYDNMRGVPVGDGDKELRVNQSSAETNENRISFYSQGFRLQNAAAPTNTSGQEYIYIAIRRPHKPPEAGTEVFAANLLSASNNGIQNVWTPGFVPDALFVKKHETSDDMRVAARMTGKKGFLVTNGNNAEPGGSTDYYHFDDPTNTIHQTYIGGGSDGTINYAFKRAPGFFDVVAYNGSNSAQNITHNLGVKPALIICKRRNSTGNWQVYADVPAGGATKYMMLDDTGIFNTNSNRWNNTEPTATQFTVGTYSDVNTSGGTYLAYLFGNLDGICKIGEYAGTGNDITIDCGFNPRFIMIKVSTNSGNGWYIVDYVRGINAGNDPWIRFNQSNAQITNTDIVDPTSGGFIVQAGGGGRVNDADGRKYLYMAIA